MKHQFNLSKMSNAVCCLQFSLSSEVTSNGKTNNYTYPTCREDLKMVRSVLFGEESSDDDVVVVASDMDLEGNENIAQLVRYSLDFVVGTQECRSAILSFMCLLLFPLRDGNGTIYQPSREDCHVITMDTCKDEWENMLGLPQVGWQIFSPDCGNLSNDTGIYVTCKNSARSQYILPFKDKLYFNGVAAVNYPPVCC